MKIHPALLHVNVTRRLNLSQISFLLAISFHVSYSAAIVETAVVGFTLIFRCSDIKKPGAMRYGLIEITDWIFYFSDEMKKISSAKKKKK